jgi:outer membrane murein-binding lipoprotein Lpp
MPNVDPELITLFQFLRHHMKSITLHAAVAAFAITLSSCDSPELVQKRDQQAIEITKLRGEVAVLEERLKDLPPDRTSDVAAIEEETKKQQSEISKLESEIKDLETKKESVQKDFDEYKRKYVIR